MYIDKLDDIVNKYNNTYHRTVKMKPPNVNSSKYIDFNKENNMEHPKCKVGNHVGISKHKTIFPKNYVPNWLEELCLKITAPWTYVISDFNGEEFFGTFCEKELQKKQIKKSFELKK